MKNLPLRVFLALLTMCGSTASAIADTSVSGYVTQLMVGDSGDPSSPATFITLNPNVSDCDLGLLVVPSTNAPVGKMMLATLISAQTASNPLVILYSTVNGQCVIKQLVLVSS